MIELECKNLESSVYLENKIQECNIKLAELYHSTNHNPIEVWNADIQTDLTCDQIQENELELVASKQSIEIDIMTLNERIKQKEKDFKFDYGNMK